MEERTFFEQSIILFSNPDFAEKPLAGTLVRLMDTPITILLIKQTTFSPDIRGSRNI